MPSIKSKICMLGAFSVGKTSLVSRFVHSIFSEKYHTTVGVKIDKKLIRFGQNEVTLLIWDIHGDDGVQDISLNYLRGASGYVLVVDGTRPDTLRTARELKSRVEDSAGALPFVALLNKYDLREEWRLEDECITQLETDGWDFLKTSAKTGLGVEEAFASLARSVLA